MRWNQGLHGAFPSCPCPLLHPCMGYSHHASPTAPSLHGAFPPCPCPLLYPCMGYSHHVPPTTTSLHGTAPPSTSPVFLHGAFPPCPTYCSNPLPHAPPTALSLHRAFSLCPAYYSISTCPLSPMPCPLLNPCMNLSQHAMPFHSKGLVHSHTENFYHAIQYKASTTVSLY